MIRILKLTPKQQGLVRRLNSILKKFEEEGIGTIVQTYDVSFRNMCFYNKENVVWEDEEYEIELGECQELDKDDYDEYCDWDSAEKLQEYDKLTWCCPDPEEMYSIPFIMFDGKAPNPRIPVEDRDVISFVINTSDIDLSPIEKNGKFGFVTEDRTIIIPCEWKDAKPFKNGFAEVMDEDGEWYSINKSGRIYRDGLALEVSDDGTKYGYVNMNGDVVIPCIWKDIGSFDEGLAPVQNDDDKWGYVDEKGDVVISCQWDEVDFFYDGLSRVMVNNKWGYINKKGDVVISCVWDCIDYFIGGITRVMNDNKWGYIDKKGDVIVPCEWKCIECNFNDGLAFVQNEKDKWGYVDRKGVVAIPCKWDEVYSFVDGHASVKDEDGNRLTIDKSGNVISTDDSDED